MGSMKCDRVDCEHIMCDKMVLGGSMYICDTCYSELVNYRKTDEVWRDVMRSANIRKLIEAFMETPPGTYDSTLVNTDEEFNRLTGGE
jgi:hypothetical protein